MNRVKRFRRRLRSIRCSVKQREGKFDLTMWPKKQGDKKKFVARVATLGEVEDVHANLTMRDGACKGHMAQG